MRFLFCFWALCLVFLVAPACAADFAAPQRVVIVGYQGHAMEPFISRDGGTLFFNNKNSPAAQTDLHWAVRIDDHSFRYRGKVEGASAPGVLDGVPSLSADNRFCFISTRAYFETLASIYCGYWENQIAQRAALQTHASPKIKGRLIFDVELSAAGDLLYVADGKFTGGPAPVRADIRLARLKGDGFELSPQDDFLFKNLNTEAALEYAAAISPDNLEIAFTRLSGAPFRPKFEIWIASRVSANAPFGPPLRANAIDGFVEAPTYAPDGASLYFHMRTKGKYEIWRAARR